MTDLCDGCIENLHCFIRKKGVKEEDCPCMHCLVKAMCKTCCDEYYNLRYVKENRSWQR